MRRCWFLIDVLAAGWGLYDSNDGISWKNNIDYFTERRAGIESFTELETRMEMGVTDV